MTVLLAELHCHAEGSAPPELARTMAAKYSVDVDKIITPDGASYQWSDFSEFLKAFDAIAGLFRTEQDFSDLSCAYYTEIAAEGAIYAEIMISPSHAERIGLGYANYLSGMADGIDRARQATGIEGRIIPVIERHYGPEEAGRAARLVVDNLHPAVTGFGMAGDERMYEPADFASAFALAADAGLSLTAHAGEVCGPQSVRACLDDLAVTRVGHGVRSIEDPDLVRRLADEKIVLEVCPGSNVALGVFRNRTEHSLDALNKAGVPVTISSDDPPFFRTSLAEEYRQTQAILGYDDGALNRLTRMSLDAAFVDAPTRARLLECLDLAMA